VSTAQLSRPASGRQPPIDPRLRERRVEVTRARGRRRLYLLIAAVGFVGVCVGGWFAAHSSLLSAKVVTVSGSVHTPDNVVLATAGLTHQPPLVSVDPSATAESLERLPWVAHATVSRSWPDGVHITIVERVPIGVMPGPNGSWAELDRTGKVLAVVGQAPAGLARFDAQGTVPSPGKSVSGAAAALAVARSLPVAFRAQVATISQQSGQVKLTLTSPLTVVLGTTSELTAKYEDVAAILAGATLHVGDTIDVSSPASPTVTPG
jgi:cell division protein FtsQ